MQHVNAYNLKPGIVYFMKNALIQGEHKSHMIDLCRCIYLFMYTCYQISSNIKYE